MHSYYRFPLCECPTVYPFIYFLKFTHFMVKGHLGSSPFEVIMNNAAINILVNVFW